MLAPHKSSLHTSLLGRGQLAAGCYLRVAMAGGTSVHPSICMSLAPGPAGGLCKAAPALTGSHFINSLSSSCSFKCSIITNKAVTLCLRLYNLAKCRYDLGFEEGREVTSRGRCRARGGGKSRGSLRLPSARLCRRGRVWMANQGMSLQQPPWLRLAHGASLLRSPKLLGTEGRRQRARGSVAVLRASGCLHVQLEKHWRHVQMKGESRLSPRSALRPCAGGEGLASGAGWRAPTSASSRNTEQGWKRHW